jgi:hypothetical protein
MPITTQDRPLDAVRRDTIDQLILNYGHGKLSLEAFERRLDAAMDARSHAELLALADDLDEFADHEYTQSKKAELGLHADPDEIDSDQEWMIHIFSGSRRENAWNVPPRIKMVNIFGGGRLDFTRAKFAARKTRITMLCVFGGATFYVPEGVNAVSKAVCLFGGVDNRVPASTDPNAPTLVIDGLVLFGGADIKLKRSFKERCMELADSVRNMFSQT